MFVAAVALAAMLLEGPASAQEGDQPEIIDDPDAPVLDGPSAPLEFDGVENPEAAVPVRSISVTGAKATVYDTGHVEICDKAGDGHSVGVEFYLNGDNTSRIAIRLYAGNNKCTSRSFGGSSVRFRAAVFEGDRHVRQSAYVSTSLPDNPNATLLYNGDDTGRPECSYANGARACWPFALNRQVMKVCDTLGDGDSARNQAYIDFSTGRQNLVRTEIQEFGGAGRCSGLLLRGQGVFDPATYRAAVYNGDTRGSTASYERNTDGS